jgi:hypothetical protein
MEAKKVASKDVTKAALKVVQWAALKVCWTVVK